MSRRKSGSKRKTQVTRKKLNIDGILLLNKPLNISSNNVLQRIKFHYQAKKAGHTGSLDPLATGCLPICFGQASKVTAFLLDSDKTYEVEGELGKVSSTGDSEGDIILERDVPVISDDEFLAIVESFIGEIDQVPPMYSALKKDGVPLYKLARQGIEIERKARRISIHSIDILSRSSTHFKLRVKCSKGTYIRTLVQDIGEALNCGAYTTALHRTSVTPFEDYPQYSFEEIKAISDHQKLLDLLLPIDTALPDFPRISLSSEQFEDITKGRKLSSDEKWQSTFSSLQFEGESSEIVRLYFQDDSSTTESFIGMGKFAKNGTLSAKRLMATN